MLVLLLILHYLPLDAHAQQYKEDSAAPLGLPMLIRFSTVIPNPERVSIERPMQFAIHSEKEGGMPLWTEDQIVTIGKGGNLTVVLGARSTEGIPKSLFVSGGARWISVSLYGVEVGPRSLVVSVPYAMKAADADTLGGLPLSAFVTREDTSASASTGVMTSTNPTFTPKLGSSSTDFSAGRLSLNLAGIGLFGYVPLWVDDAGTLGTSSIYDNGKIGIGTSNPRFSLDVQNSDTSATGAQLLNVQTPSVNGARIFFNSTSANGRAYGIGSNFMMGLGEFGVYDYTAGAPRMVINRSGFMGVGVADPKYTLDIANTDTAAGGSSLLQLTTPSRNGAKIVFNSTAANGRSYGFGSNFITGTGEFGIYDYNASATRLIVTAAGNVGIGTVSPVSALDIVGDLRLAGTVSVTGGGNGITFPDGTKQSTAAQPLIAGDSSVSITGNTISLSPAGVGTSALSDGSVVASKVADGAILQSKLEPGIVSTIASKAVLGANAFTAAQTITVNDPLGYALRGQNTATSGSADAVRGETASSNGRGVYGYASDSKTTSTAVGVSGISASGKGIGIYGEASSTTGASYAVSGLTRSNGGVGVFGQAVATSTSGLNSTKGVYGQVLGDNGSAGLYGEASSTTALTTHYGAYGIARGKSGIGLYGETDTLSTASEPVGVAGVARSSTGYAAKFFKYSTAGNVIAAYSAPTSSDTPNLIMRLDGLGNLHAAGAVSGGGADFAEMVATSPASQLEAGDVLVISENDDRSVERSSESYSTRVIGIYSTKPGFVGTPHSLATSSIAEIPVAMIGIVPCKASAENGSIRRGDLLVASSTPGHVMKATDRTKLAGAVVGKAMQSLETGTGVIEIAVTLQ
jgi:hypothetical protein